MKPLKIIVDNRIRLRMDRLDDEVLGELQADFTYKNPQKAFLRQIGKPVWNLPDVYETWKKSGKYISFPRGGMAKIRSILDDKEIDYVFRNRRTEGAPCVDFPKYIGPELRYYQEEGIQAALRKENCIIRAPTGSGKSLLAIALAARIKLNTLVILPTVALFKQWVRDANEALDVGNLGVGVIHGKKRTLRPITAAVQKSLSNALDDPEFEESLKDFFGVIIVDECQKCAASSYIKVVDPWPSRYRIGISADERRNDRKDFLTHDLLGNKAYEIKRDQLEEEGHVLDVEIRVIPTDFEAPWYGIPEEEIDIEDGEVEITEQKELDFKRLVEEMGADKSRTELGINVALEEVSQGNQVIMLTHRREQCYLMEQEILSHGVPTGFFIGGADHEKEFQATRTGITNGQIKVGIGTYQALGVGVNLPSVSIGIAMTPIAGNRFNFNQVRGRLCRLSEGKTAGVLYVLWDRNVYPEHLRNMASWNPTVKVLIGDEWTDARKYLGMKARRKTRPRLAS